MLKFHNRGTVHATSADRLAYDAPKRAFPRSLPPKRRRFGIPPWEQIGSRAYENARWVHMPKTYSQDKLHSLMRLVADSIGCRYQVLHLPEQEPISYVMGPGTAAVIALNAQIPRRRAEIPANACDVTCIRLRVPFGKRWKPLPPEIHEKLEMACDNLGIRWAILDPLKKGTIIPVLEHWAVFVVVKDDDGTMVESSAPVAPLWGAGLNGGVRRRGSPKENRRSAGGTGSASWVHNAIKQPRFRRNQMQVAS